jgi:hypothetical protein
MTWILTLRVLARTMRSMPIYFLDPLTRLLPSVGRSRRDKPTLKERPLIMREQAS